MVSSPLVSGKDNIKTLTFPGYDSGTYRVNYP
jgi:hypothetical protein